MPRSSDLPAFDFALRSQRLDGPGLYYGRRGRVGPVDVSRLEELLRAWQARDPYKRMAVIPLMAPGTFDDGAEHTVEALLGDRMVDFGVDEDLVVPGFWANDVPGFVVRKQRAMKDEDEDAFRELAERFTVPFGGLLDGPFEAHLVRCPRMGELADRVELLCGLGMRPADAEGLEPPDGMSTWLATEDWRIDGTVLAEVAAPAIHLPVSMDAVVTGLSAAADAIQSAAVTAPWQRFVTEVGWTDVDLEPRLYIRPS